MEQKCLNANLIAGFDQQKYVILISSLLKQDVGVGWDIYKMILFI